MQQNPQKPLREYVENIMVALFLALCVRTFILTGYKVPTTSMAPNLKPGDFIFSYRLPFGVKVPFMTTKVAGQLPQRGEIVVFTFPDIPKVNYVKRVVGLPGDRIELRNGRLIVNNLSFQYEKLSSEILGDLEGSENQILLQESNRSESRSIILQKRDSEKSFGPIIVPENEVFLLGDNRDSSDDSRYWGTVPANRLEGRVVLIWLSLNWQNKWLFQSLPEVRWERVFSKVH